MFSKLKKLTSSSEESPPSSPTTTLSSSYETSRLKLTLSASDILELNQVLDKVTTDTSKWLKIKEKDPKSVHYKSKCYTASNGQDYNVSVYKVFDPLVEQYAYIADTLIPEANPQNILFYYSIPTQRKFFFLFIFSKFV